MTSQKSPSVVGHQSEKQKWPSFFPLVRSARSEEKVEIKNIRANTRGCEWKWKIRVTKAMKKPELRKADWTVGVNRI